MPLQDRLADSLLGASTRWWGRYVAAGMITLLSVLLVAVLWRRLGAIPDPGLILLFTVASATYLAGGMAGMLSAAIVLFCSFLLFSHPLYPFRYSELDWRQMMVIIVACPVIALMVGSLKEQVDRLRIVTSEIQALREEARRSETIKESHFQCEQRFRLLAEHMTRFAVCTLDAGGSVRNWNVGAERVLGYSDPEILGQSYSRFFTREDLLARQPERLLEQVRFFDRAIEEEGWRLRKGGARFRARTMLLTMKDSRGAPVGSLMALWDLSAPGEDLLR
ncbi:MAG TPA: PAS domain-containing protein [Burkholderiales bacterium]|nr:PAS domain-containing protein [Burkholderiales bacterium]